MTIWDRYLARRFAATWVKTVLALLFVFILVDLLTHRRSTILNNDVPWSVVLAYYAWLAPMVLHEFQLAALAVLISALLVFGSAAQHNEVTAMLAGGVRLRRQVLTPVVMALSLTAGLFVFEETAGVASARRYLAIEKRYFVVSQQTARPGLSWADLEGGWRCHVMKFNRPALTGEDVLMVREGELQSEQVRARRIYWDPGLAQWIIEDGLWSVFDESGERTARHRRVTQETAPIVETPDDLFALEADTHAKTAPQLAADIARAESRGAPAARLAVDFHGKFSKPVLSFVMIWLAIPFAIRLRRGGIAVSFGISIAIGLAYLMVFIIAQGLGYIDRVPAVFAAWCANVLFLALGLALFTRTPT